MSFIYFRLLALSKAQCRIAHGIYIPMQWVTKWSILPRLCQASLTWRDCDQQPVAWTCTYIYTRYFVFCCTYYMYSHRVYNGFEMKQYTIELKINIIVFLKWVVWVLFTVMVFFLYFCLRCGHGLCNGENESRNYIKQKDPKLYNIINYVFLNNNETKMANLGNCVTWSRSCEQYKRQLDTISVLTNPYLSHFEGSGTRQNKTKLALLNIAILGRANRIVILIQAYKKLALLFCSWRYVALND